MIFTEAIFFGFFALVFAAHWLAQAQSQRLWILLGASAVFYGWWDWRFLGLIAFVILVSWATANFTAARRSGDRNRRLALTAGIGSVLAVLGVFKYANFFADSAASALTSVGITPSWPVLNILLPVGISFYVFQAISYMVDVARGQIPAERRLHRVALYIAFFPQLVAGPIVRAASFFPQMDRRRRLTGALVASGIRAFLIGFVYKAAIADPLAGFVDPVFGDALASGDSDLSVWSNAALVGATLAFAAQIYFDFAGYSLMAIGVARLLGYYIPPNFATPYASASIQEFWRRWHISLSSWLRDYLYIPLGGNRKGRLTTQRNLLATMVLGGLWHGAAWTFLAWGALHGVALILNRLWRGSTGWVLGLVLTQLFVLMAWVPFRAESFSDTLEVWSAFLGLRPGGVGELSAIVFAVPLFILADIALSRRRRWKLYAIKRPAIASAGLGALVALCFALYPLQAAPFVYFQF